MIKRTFYKDRPAIEISCDAFTAVFLPSDGAKMASFKTNDGEELLAQAITEKYLRLDLDSDYEKCECSAFDDMFPTIDPCCINGLEYLDHGEVCRREHTVEIYNGKIYFTCELPRLKIIYEKTIYVENDSLYIKYCIKNGNNFDFPYVWAGHMMLKGESGAYVVSNYKKGSLIRIMFGNPKSKDSVHILPDIGNENYKYYFTEAISQLKCGVVYPHSKTEINVEFDNDIIKYFGVWINPGDLNDMYNIALEPCSAPYDNPVNAQKENISSYIRANEKIDFTMKMSYKKI